MQVLLVVFFIAIAALFGCVAIVATLQYRSIEKEVDAPLDYVADKYDVFGPYGFNCKHMRDLARLIGWRRK